MAHTSPAVNLIWALLAVMLGTFLVYHLWSFDRFKCLWWNHGPHSGAFKRLMTYAYLLSVPLIIFYAVGFAIIKYNYGFSVVPGLGIVPTPYEEWSPTARSAIFPLYLSFSVAWALELVTHLEELCFWLFVVNASSFVQQDWFKSHYFKTWATGSCTAVVAMPLITILTRGNVNKCEAYTFLVGGLASLALTIWFLPVLWAFTPFIENLKELEVENNTLVRLTTYHELNCIRVVFRFLFTVPIIILGVDGVRPHQHINDKMFPTDFLAIIAGIGCVVSSGITLVIFFPRSIPDEIAHKERRRLRPKARQPNRNRPSASSFWTRGGSGSAGTGDSDDNDNDALSYISVVPSKMDLGTLDIAGDSLAGLPTLPSDARADTYAYDHSDTDVGHHANGSASMSMAGLPSYDVAARLPRDPPPPLLPRSHRHHPHHHPSPSPPRHQHPYAVGGKMRMASPPEEGETEAERDKGPMALQPNRLNRSGDVELGGVLTPHEVDVMRAQSTRRSEGPSGDGGERGRQRRSTGGASSGVSGGRSQKRSVSSLVYQWRSPIDIGRPSCSGSEHTGSPSVHRFFGTHCVVCPPKSCKN